MIGLTNARAHKADIGKALFDKTVDTSHPCVGEGWILVLFEEGELGAVPRCEDCAIRLDTIGLVRTMLGDVEGTVRIGVRRPSLDFYHTIASVLDGHVDKERAHSIPEAFALLSRHVRDGLVGLDEEH